MDPTANGSPPLGFPGLLDWPLLCLLIHKLDTTDLGLTMHPTGRMDLKAYGLLATGASIQWEGAPARQCWESLMEILAPGGPQSFIRCQTDDGSLALRIHRENLADGSTHYALRTAGREGPREPLAWADAAAWLMARHDAEQLGAIAMPGDISGRTKRPRL